MNRRHALKPWGPGACPCASNRGWPQKARTGAMKGTVARRMWRSRTPPTRPARSDLQHSPSEIEATIKNRNAGVRSLGQGRRYHRTTMAHHQLHFAEGVRMTLGAVKYTLAAGPLIASENKIGGKNFPMEKPISAHDRKAARSRWSRACWHRRRMPVQQDRQRPCRRGRAPAVKADARDRRNTLLPGTGSDILLPGSLDDTALLGNRRMAAPAERPDHGGGERIPSRVFTKTLSDKQRARSEGQSPYVLTASRTGNTVNQSGRRRRLVAHSGLKPEIAVRSEPEGGRGAGPAYQYDRI